jgi:hypothetical protein
MPMTLSLRDYLFVIGFIVYFGLGLLLGNPLFNIVVNWLIFFVGARLFFDWIYKDAEARGMDAKVWQVIVILAFPVGLMAYLFTRNKKKDQIIL